MPLRSSMGRASVGGELAVDAPVRLLDVLEDDLHLVGGGLADLHHGLGDGGGDLALLLVGAPREPLHGDVWHFIIHLSSTCLWHVDRGPSWSRLPARRGPVILPRECAASRVASLRRVSHAAEKAVNASDFA